MSRKKRTQNFKKQVLNEWVIELFKFVDKYPHKAWCWEALSQLSSTTMDYIENNLHRNWKWDRISYNPNLTIEIIKKYSNKKWDWETLYKYY